MEVINGGMRKAIKAMCVVAQTSQFITLMPKPQDFITRIVGDVVYLSAQVKVLSDNMNKLLDSYANIPTDYLNTQMNSITGSLTSITDRMNTFAQNGVEQTVGLAENAAKMVTEVTGTVIDATGAVVSATTGLASAVAESNYIIIGKKDVAEDIHDNTEATLEWIDNKFKNVKADATEPLKKTTQKITDLKTKMTNKIDDVSEAINNRITDTFKPITSLIEKLREQMKKLENKLDSGFKDVTGMDSMSQKLKQVSDNLKEEVKDEKKKELHMVQSVSANLSEVIKNFSIGKAVLAFTGVVTQSVIVKLGLDELPPIDFESMLYKIRDDSEVSTEDLYREYDSLFNSTDSEYRELIEFGENAKRIPKEERKYSAKNYKEFVKTYDGELKKQRESIRQMMKSYSAKDEESKMNDVVTKKELKSAIKEVRKFRKQVKNAKQANKLKNIIGTELKKLKKEADTRCKRVQSDWNQCIAQYKKAIKEIKRFFESGGSSERFINDCCDKINQNCTKIKDLCIDIASELICCNIKVGTPSDIGPVYPNPVYKLSDFWMDIKTIIKFIKDIITLLISIFNHINKLARLMLNGINNLDEVIKQLMGLLGLKWLMDLVQSIITALGANITDAKDKLENTLSPVPFSDTDEYNNTIEALDQLIESQEIDKEHTETLADVISLLETIPDKEINKLIGKIDDIRRMTSISDSKLDDVEDLIDELEKQGDKIVAYKCPILKETGNTENVDVEKVAETGDTSQVNADIKFIGWRYFHPTLEHTKDTYYSSSKRDKIRKKAKSKIMKKAAKTGNKKKGGVAKLKRANVGKKSTKIDKAYVAFYWYTYYTEDLERDCFDKLTDDGATIIDSIVHTQNGTIVEITDVNGQKRKVFVANNMVKSGDYVVVEGVKYRVN